MNYISFEHLSKSYGDNVLFEDISFHLNKGEKVAIVAENGTGKSTLLKIIAGSESPEGENCSVYFRKDIKIKYLSQAPQFDPEMTVLDAVFDMDLPSITALKAYEEALLFPEKHALMESAMEQMDNLNAWDFEANVKSILNKFNIGDLTRKVGILSGGQQKRLALAKILLEEPDLLILDEPTNHLDLDMIEWLEAKLQEPNLTLLMVTHDRYFLDRVCDSIVELNDQTMYRYSGNYTDFLEKKLAREANDLVVHDRTSKMLRRELDWVRRQPKARGTKSKARVDAYHKKKEENQKFSTKGVMQIEIKGQRMGSKILEAHDISKSFGDIKIVDGFDYKFKKKDRVGIIGKNGVGKSTLIKLLTKEIRPDTGTVVVGGTVQFGYYSQDGLVLEKDKMLIDVVRDIAEYIPLDKGAKLTAAQLLERFLFNRKKQQTYASTLSGGEMRRLYLLTILMQNPNFLILDEPTNDLDLMTLNILEDFLMDFPGCLLIVTHDRYFMDKIVDHLFIMEGEGKVRDFNGTHTMYRNWLKTQPKEGQSQPKKEKIVEIEQDSKEERKLTYDERKELGRLEKEIAKLEARKVAIHAIFAENNSEQDELVKLSKELLEIDEKMEQKEERWMELVEFS